MIKVFLRKIQQVDPNGSDSGWNGLDFTELMFNCGNQNIITDTEWFFLMSKELIYTSYTVASCKKIPLTHGDIQYLQRVLETSFKTKTPN